MECNHLKLLEHPRPSRNTKWEIHCKIWGSCSAVAEDMGLLGCDTHRENNARGFKGLCAIILWVKWSNKNRPTGKVCVLYRYGWCGWWMMRRWQDGCGGSGRGPWLTGWGGGCSWEGYLFFLHLDCHSQLVGWYAEAHPTTTTIGVPPCPAIRYPIRQCLCHTCS
jgi:hypothetical protein